MLVQDILKLDNNASVEGTFLINDSKLKPFNDKEGHYLTFSLQDKTGIVWAKIWDDAENISKSIKEQNIEIVDIQGRTNIYNNKVQITVYKIKKTDSFDLKNIIKVSEKDPVVMYNQLSSMMQEICDRDLHAIWEFYKTNLSFLEKFMMWPGGKGTVHHAYQHGLLEHTLSVMSLVKSFKKELTLPVNIEKTLLGAFLHDIGKIDAYNYNVKTTMTNSGRLHEHTALGYYAFRKNLDSLDIKNKDDLAEELGHIILSHHGTYEHHAIIKPMTLEAKFVAFADYLDSDSNYMMQQLEYNVDEEGWVFDNLNEQFYFKRPSLLKRRKKI